jgi:histidinol-phosphate aminotransferase
VVADVAATRLPQPVPALARIERLPEGGRERHGFLGLDRNERLSPLPAEARAAVEAALTAVDLTTYPEVEGLYEDVAAWLEVDQARLRLTAGSDAAIRALHHCYVGPGDRTVSLDPSYAMYPIYTRMFAGEPTLIPFDGDLRVDTDALLGAVRPGVKLVLLAEPNQPTGTSLGDDVLRAVLDRAAEAGALVVVDEAYYPFSEHTVVGWLDLYPHLVITRTFSKAWGLAGLRVGFAAADPEVAANLYKVRAAYDVNAAAAAAARALLARPEVATGYAEEVRAGREALAERARALLLEPLPGLTNFELIRVADRIDPADLVGRLHARGTIVKGPFSTPGLADCIRVTLGPPELMERFADQLEEVLEEG